MTVPTGPVYYPFAVVPPTSSSNVFPNDVVIETVYPGVIFDAQEAGSVYSVIREVNGCLWFALNADFNETTLQWTQEDPTNPNTPAYAMELCSSGTWQWYQAQPTLVPGTPVNWVQLYLIRGNGTVDSTPLTVTSSGPGLNQLTSTWDAGSVTQVEARRVVITDISSAANSLLDNLVVNGDSKWAVDKNGVLVNGMVPASSVINLFNNPTFTGTSTFNGPAVFNSTLDAFGAATFHSSLTADSTFFAVGLATLNGHANINSGLTVTGGEVINGGSTVNGGAAVNGGENVFGTAVFHGTVENASGGPVVPISSPDNSITVSTVANGYELEQTNSGVGSIVLDAALQAAPPNTSTIAIPGSVGNWNVTITVVVEMTAPLVTGTVTVTGVGGSGSWNSNSRTITNPGTPYITVLMEGTASHGDFVSAAVTASGGTIASFDYTMICTRFS